MLAYCHYLGEQTIGSTSAGKALIEAEDTLNCIRLICFIFFLGIIFLILTMVERSTSSKNKKN